MIGGFFGLMIGAEMGCYRYGGLIQIGAGMSAGMMIGWTEWSGAIAPVIVGATEGGFFYKKQARLYGATPAGTI